jgi:outer membrane lipoprotein SlyB
MRIIAILSVIGLLLSGCGTLVGAGAGGLAGNQFGSGSGKTAATAAGVIGGGILGHELTGN